MNFRYACKSIIRFALKIRRFAGRLSIVFIAVAIIIIAIVTNHRSVNQELIDSSIHGNLAQVRHCLDRGADVNAVSDTGYSALCYASDQGYQNIVRLLLDRGANVNIRASSGYTPLICAVEGGNVEVMKLLLAYGAHVNATMDDGNTALTDAACLGRTEVARLLLEHGANANAKWHDEGHEGGSRFEHSMIESARSYPEIIKLLKFYGAK